MREARHLSAVKNVFSYRWVVGAFIALFFAMQSYSVSHASTYGDAPHEHDGVACAVTVMSDDQLAIIPAPIVGNIIPTGISETPYPDFATILYLIPQGRAPPPRGPPASV